MRVESHTDSHCVLKLLQQTQCWEITASGQESHSLAGKEEMLLLRDKCVHVHSSGHSKVFHVTL